MHTKVPGRLRQVLLFFFLSKAQFSSGLDPENVLATSVDENRYAWTDEGGVDLRKSVLTFQAPKVLRVRSRSFWWTGEPVLSPSEFHVCRHRMVYVAGNLLSTMACCSIVHRACHAKRSRSFDQKKIGRDNATAQLEIWGWPSESSERI